MKFYLCRWPNGDVSLAAGPSRVEIDRVLDEVANADRAQMIPIKADAFALHFRLKERAERTPGSITDLLEFPTAPMQSVSESLFHYFNEAYPVLSDAFNAEVDLELTNKPTEDEIDAARRQIATALEIERTRIEAKEIKFSKDVNSAHIQKRMDFPKRLAEEPNENHLQPFQQRRDILQPIRKPRKKSH